MAQTKKGLIPLCYYSIKALCQLRTVMNLFPKVSEENMKKVIQRLGLKRPPSAPWVHGVAVQNGLIVQFKKGRDTF